MMRMILTGRLEAASSAVAIAGQPSSSPPTGAHFLLIGLGAPGSGYTIDACLSACQCAGAEGYRDGDPSGDRDRISSSS